MLANMKLHGPATRAIRERSGLTVTALALRVGCTQGHMSAVEAGDRKASPELILSIARELKVDLPAVLCDPDEYMVKPKRVAA